MTRAGRQLACRQLRRSDEVMPSNASNSEAHTEEGTPIVRDRLTSLPPEVLRGIISLLHGNEEALWIDKADLKSMNSLCHPVTGPIVKEELFKHLTLKLTYDYDRQKQTWMKPKLLQLLETESSFAEYVKQHTKALRLVINPLPESFKIAVTHDLDPHVRPKGTELWFNHIRSRLGDPDPTAPCIYVAESTRRRLVPRQTPLNDLPSLFNRLFGAVKDDEGLPARETIESDAKGRSVTRQLFSSYIFTALGAITSRLPKLRHIEAGMPKYDPSSPYDWRGIHLQLRPDIRSRDLYETTSEDCKQHPRPQSSRIIRLAEHAVRPFRKCGTFSR